MKKALWIVVDAIIVVVVIRTLPLIVRSFVTVVPRRATTYGTMHVTKRRILRYAHMHDRLPKALDELPIIEKFGNDLEDGWGRRILYQFVQNNTVTLISYGKDGVPGGEGNDEDQVAVFIAKDADGRWQEELCDWIIDPYGHRPNSASTR